MPVQQSDPKATSQCKHCGAWHGGGLHSDAPKVCEDCYKKGKR